MLDHVGSAASALFLASSLHGYLFGAILSQVSQRKDILIKASLLRCYFFNINLFIYLLLAALGLRCCMRASSSCGEQGLLFIAVRGLLIAVASLVAEHRL